MKKLLNSKTLLTCCKNYFATLNLGKEAGKLLVSSNFSIAAAFVLPESCVISSNRSVARTNESHIAVTGKRRFAFYDEETINNTFVSTEDKVQNVVVSGANISNLNNPSNTSFASMGLIETFTLTKIAYRASSDSRQVQISKINGDGADFIELRRGLKAGDILIFFKYITRDTFFVVGIPKSYYDGEYDIKRSGDYYDNLECSHSVPIKSALTNIANAIDPAARIESEDLLADAIYQQQINATDSPLDEDEEEDDDSYTNEDYEENKNTHKNNRPTTNALLAKKAIRKNGYRCIFSSSDNPHQTFMKENGTQYMEAHHIVPVAKQEKFRKKLDTKANIVPVCPTCHCKLHYGKKSDVDILLTTLFTMRENALIQSGINITLDQLKSYYN